MDVKIDDRRKNSALRNKVDALRELLLHKSDPRLLLDRTLKSILELVNAEYGLVSSITVSNHNTVIAEGPTCYKRSHTINGEVELIRQIVRRPGEWINRYAKQYLAQGKPLYISDLNSEAAQNDFPAELQPVKNALIVPLMSLDECFAVILVVNYGEKFTNLDLNNIWPLLSTCGLVFRTHNTRLLNQAVLHKFDASANEKSKLMFVAHDAIITVDEKHIILSFNPAAEKTFKCSAQEAIGSSLEEFLPSNDINMQHHAKYEVSILQNPPTLNHVTSGRDAKGDEVALRYEIYTTNKDDKRYTTYVLQNLSEQLEIQRQHDEALSRLKAITDLAPVGILQTDKDWNGIYANETWCSMTGLTPEEVGEQGWINALHPSDVKTVISELHKKLSEGLEFSGDVRFMNAFGEIMLVQINARPLFDIHGHFIGFIATFVDVTTLRRTEMQLRNLAEQDSLTGLSNRNAFMDKLQNAIDRASRRGPIGVVYLDLDGFKHINDTLGHDKGDYLLKTISDRIRDITRKEDTVARIGGDEFTMILEALHDPRYAAEMVNEILHSIALPMVIDDQTLYISASAGIAIGDQDSDPKLLLRQADTALYKAKAQGRNNYQYFTQEMTVAAEQRLALHNEIHAAIEKHEFCVAYQPQVMLADESIVGTEALLRWNHPNKGIQSPQCFLSMLEESKLIVPLGTWILEEACRQHATWIKQGVLGPDTTISVNISASQFYQTNLADTISNILIKTQLPAENLILEITETVIMRDMKKCKLELQSLKEMGVRISLDDFGTGYSSLSQLCQLPIDQIKLDQSFIHNLFEDPKTATVARSVLLLGNELGLDVLVEGIDNKRKHAFLLDTGFKSGQGFFYSKPEFAEILQPYFVSALNHQRTM